MLFPRPPLCENHRALDVPLFNMNHTAHNDCLFCRNDLDSIFIRGNLGFVRWDSHPVNEGHALVIPYRHVPGYFDVTDEERQELWALVDQGKEVIENRYHPQGYNIGINIGSMAGQSIFHMHIHLIPRYRGDVENPKGGVRGVIPKKQRYP